MTSPDVRRLPPSDVLRKLGALFAAPAHDRHVYCVYGSYEQLRPFSARLRKEVEKGSFNKLGRVEYLSLRRDLLQHLKARGLYDQVARLADQRRDEQVKRWLSAGFRDLVTSRIEAAGVVGLVLADFELLYAYDLGENDISLARQVAINGKRVCLLVPGAMRDGRLWIFDDDPESRREFPEALVFTNSGWVFELTDERSHGHGRSGC
jgi:hypothetical protein